MTTHSRLGKQGQQLALSSFRQGGMTPFHPNVRFATGTKEMSNVIAIADDSSEETVRASSSSSSAPPGLIASMSQAMTSVTVSSTNHHSTKRERSDEQGQSSNERRVAQRTAENKCKSQVSIAALVLELNRKDDLSAAERYFPQLLMALHERNIVKRVQKQKEFYQVGGHLVVASKMSKYPESKLLQQSGILIILHASYRNEDMRAAIGKVEGIQVILQAMKRFGDDRDVVYQGFQALSNLVSDKPNAELLVNGLRAIPFLTEKMEEYDQDGDLLRWACELLKRLCRFNRLRKVLFEEGAVDSLAFVLNHHKFNEKLQMAARQAMKLLL